MLGILIMFFCVFICSVIAGAVFSFVGIPFLHWINKTPAEHRNIGVGKKLLIAIIVGSILFPIGSILLQMVVGIMLPQARRTIGRTDFSRNSPSADIIDSTNRIRREHGVREIKEEWSFYGREFGKEVWKDTKGNPCKTIVFTNDSYEVIWYEQDSYWTGRTFPSTDPDAGDNHERLILTHHYGASLFTVYAATDNKEIKSLVENLKLTYLYPNIYGAYQGGAGARGESNAETLEVADTILTKWGLSRL
ncbi:MAG: hypothetical protein ACYS21_16670 [Planctomycetota bacterium]